MARRPRQDAPDTWHHVMNRGLARRTLFETDADRRYFLALLAREVRAGRLEVHAFCVLLTHFHLLVRSRTGELSRSLRIIQNRYARWFNRTRRRDGPLFRGRFLSRRVDTLAYRRNVLVYIHDNAVAAGVVAAAADDPWSSAGRLAGGTAPRWLETSWVESELAARGRGATVAERLATAFPSRVEEGFRHWVETQLHARLPAAADDEDVSLKYAGSPKVVAWTIRKAKLADGTRPWTPPQAATVVDRVLRRARRASGRLLGFFKSKTKDAWVVLRAGLFRMLSGCSHRWIGLLTGRHASTISRDVRDHARLLAAHPPYAALTARLSHLALETPR